MAGWNRVHLAVLSPRAHSNITSTGTAANANSMTNSTIREVSWTTQNDTKRIIASLQLAQVQTLRTMHLTLGAFSLALILLTIYRIISDANRAAKLAAPQDKQRFRALRNVHTAEVFPLALACGTAMQQIIFIAVQSTTLNRVTSANCRGLAMIALPAIFLIGLITLIFGLEMAIRGSKRERFAPRKRWNTTICIAIISFLSLLTWMPTVIWPMFDRCIGNLIWIVVRYELLSLALLSVMVASFLALAAFISIQLMRTTHMNLNERIAASRMCYYLLLAAMIYALVIPVEVHTLRRDLRNALVTSRIAEVALFSSGLAISFFHLFLRANANRMIIKPNSDFRQSFEQKRPKLRFFGPSDLEMNISGPVALERSPRLEVRQGLIDVGPEKNRADFDASYFERADRPLTPSSTKSASAIDPTRWPLPPDANTDNDDLHKRTKSSYSLFPTRADEIPRLPATVYAAPTGPGTNRSIARLALRRHARQDSLDVNTKSVTDVGEAFGFLMRPPPLFSGRHDRKGSGDSVATVQIGLRFSVAPGALSAGKATRTETLEPSSLSEPPLQRGGTESSIESLGLPIQSPSAKTSFGDLRSKTPPDFPRLSPLLSPTLLSPKSMEPFAPPNLASATDLETQRHKVLPAIPAISAVSFATGTTIDVPVTQPTSSLVPPASMLALSGLRMNPISPYLPPPRTPSSASASSPIASTPTTAVPTASDPSRADSTVTQWPALTDSPEGRQSPTRSPTASIPLGEGTMARSPPGKGWI